MKWKCRRIQAVLADEGAHALRSDTAAQAHLESCSECFEVLENLSRLDAELAGLARHDAPDELVERLLARGELREPLPPPRKRRVILSWKRPPRWLGMAAAAAVVVLVATLIVPQATHKPGSPGAGIALSRSVQPARPQTEEEKLDELSKQLEALGYLGGEGAPVEAAPASTADAPSITPPGREAPRQDRDALESGKKEDRGRLRRSGSRQNKAAPRAPAAATPAEVAPVLEENFTVTSEAPAVDERKSTITFRGGSPQTTVPGDIPSARDPWVILESTEGLILDRINVGGNESGQSSEARFAEDDEAGSYERFEPDIEVPPLHRSQQAAAGFLLERRRIEGLRFQAAEGYWANTYVPGDPALRLLDSRLGKLDRSPWQPFVDEPLQLHDASRQPVRPFDPPTQAALAAYLHADWQSVNGPTRMLVQVGLQGTPRYSGRRPAMNVGVVLDLRGSASTENLAAMRALVSALARAKDVGDRFRLFVAGRPGGELLEPSEFRHGPVTVALQQLAEPTAAGLSLTLPEALAAAIDAVAASDDPTQPLGSSLVMLVTAQSLAPFADDLVAQAHASAVAGVPVSVVGIETTSEDLERLALAGQGHRRLLRTPAEAEALVDRELSAVGRVIARALRLRIRLAPGVKLVDVVGSRRLEEVLASQVREAEQSIDRRLARNLGIEADRGEDEEGIQIVIPSFYAGDSHVVLLDVVVPGPGAVADLTVRYKDLVRMGNGVARAHLDVSRGEPSRGPLEVGVLGNFLAHRLEQTLRRAGAWLDSGQHEEAVRELASLRHLLAGLRVEVAGFDKDRGLARDIAMLDEYLTLLAAGVGREDPDRESLADSLRYAGRLKLLPRPLSGGAP